MVPLCSGRIARVPPYSSYSMRSPFHVRGYHPLWPDFPDCSTKTYAIMSTGLFRFRSPLLTESRLISIPPVTEMFQFTGFAPCNLCIQSKVPPKRWVSPFGNLRIEAYLPAPRSLSQATTSFIAFCRQGIHHVRLFT